MAAGNGGFTNLLKCSHTWKQNVPCPHSLDPIRVSVYVYMYMYMLCAYKYFHVSVTMCAAVFVTVCVRTCSLYMSVRLFVGVQGSFREQVGGCAAMYWPPDISQPA